MVELPPGATPGIKTSPRRDTLYSMAKRFRPESENEHITKAKIFDQQMAQLEREFARIDLNGDG
jgi:hypothetical protein